MGCNYKKVIKKTTGWYPISWIPSDDTNEYRKFIDEFGVGGAVRGCYQVALREDIDTIGEELVHEKIGYTGKGQDVLKRTSAIRAPKGNHGVRVYITTYELDRAKDVVVRYLIVENIDNKEHELERLLHGEHQKEFGWNFAWHEASGGEAGRYVRVLDELDYLTSDLLLQLMGEIVKISKRKAAEEYEKKIIKTLQPV